ncbi:CHAT domain-containing tetratricopeptide repeat protein [Glycomyces sp. L485]|uniref:CHAT domain-containing protein n=1 Tax=Glycomyces sp. L485 TaxID=2909235 RepID=UPI001F4AFC12|nr:CHAT domain-containing protein [Glycomyces sp. L485]MCH7231242.1 CHAT domain-containing tetratricopeptide repeat protein [Glycomyces sp. L485]
MILAIRAPGLAFSGDAPSGLAMLDHADSCATPADRGMLLHQRAFILWQNGRLPEALKWFEKAEPMLEEHGPDWLYGALFHNRAAVWRELGELQKGLKSEQRARELFAVAGHHVHSTKAQHAEALFWLDLGEITRAISGFEQVRLLYREHAPELEAFVNGSYAEALMRVGMNRQAGEHCDEAIASWRLHGDVRNSAFTEYRRAVIAHESGDYEMAETWARQALDSLYSQGIETWSFLAQLLVLQARFDAERDDSGFSSKVDRLCDALESRGLTLRLDQARILAARSYIRAGDLETAQERLSRPLEAQGYEQLPANLARHLALAELARARNRDPFPALQAGLNLLDEYRTQFGSMEFQAGVSALGIQLASMGLTGATTSGSPVMMLEWAERCRGQALRIPPVKPSADPEAREALARLRQARQRLWDLQVEGKEADEALKRVHELEEEIRAYDRTKPGPRQQSERIPAERIHERARERGTVIVNLFEVGGYLRAVLAGAGSIRHVQLMKLDAAAETGRRLGADLDALGAPFKLPDRLRLSVEGSLRRNAEALADGIWYPISEFVGDRQVVIVPHSQIAWVPWPLLPPLRGRPMTVAPSSEAWMRAVSRPAVHGPALVAAGPALNTAGTEIDSIADLYPGAHLMRADESDPELILKALDGASVAHLAAHGHHEPDNVLFSRLDFRQGPLNAYELLGLDQPPGHVVLSSCDLGRSTVAVGHETLGFTAALLHAGTPTVVSSLGRVPDDLAAEMMVDYHRCCATGASPAEALAAVGENRPWHPFVCFGALSGIANQS